MKTKNGLERLFNINKNGINKPNILDLYKEYSFYTQILGWEDRRAYTAMESRYLYEDIKPLRFRDDHIYDDIQTIVKGLKLFVNGERTSKQVMDNRILPYISIYKFNFEQLERQVKAIYNFERIKDIK
jgi:hypothetical protein